MQKQIDNIDSSLQNFDKLPDSARVRLPVVKGLFSCSSATVWRNVNNGVFPKPSKLTPRTTTWLVGDLRKLLAANAGES